MLFLSGASALLWACERGPADGNVRRGRGLRAAELTAAEEAVLIDQAARAAFDVGPGLVLRLHPQRLPRTGGYGSGEPVRAELLTVLRARGVVRGSCTPRREAPHARDTPRCPGRETGYVLRVSDPLRAGGDTVQLYLAAETFGPEQGRLPEALRFEKVYQLVGHGMQWRVAREARAREE